MEHVKNLLQGLESLIRNETMATTLVLLAGIVAVETILHVFGFSGWWANRSVERREVTALRDDLALALAVESEPTSKGVIVEGDRALGTRSAPYQG